MIARRADRKEGQSSDFRDLVKYILDPAKLDPTTIRIANCDAETSDEVIAVVKATQKMNARAEGDPTYHLVIAFPPGERPTPDQLADIEEELCAAIGLGAHQRISVGHIDKDHFHVHVAVNKVHPENFRFIEPYFDKLKLNAARKRLEIKHGLTRTAHQARPSRGAPGRAGDLEARAGEVSLLGWIKENAAPALLAALDGEAGWRSLHEALAGYGLAIKPHGAGLVVLQEDSGIAVKASNVDRRLSLKALHKRLGAYEPPPTRQKSAEPGGENPRYRRGPKQPGAAAQKLYAQFQRQREQARKARNAAFARRRETRARGERPESAAAIAAAHPLQTWLAFLQTEASRGDAEALSVLRWRERRQRKAAQALLTAENADEARQVVFAHLKPYARRNGALVYRVRDGGVVSDEARCIRVEEVSAHAAFLALTLAAERFAGQALVVEGTDEFKLQLAAMAATQRPGVRFADPALEAERERLAAETPVARRATGERSGVAPKHRRGR